MDGFLLCWYFLTALSVAWLLYDLITNTPTMWVMGLAWVLVVLYSGPLGLFFYLISCRQPMPNTHDAFIDVHWKQALGSEIHCVAGDATAIIITAAILSLFSVPNGLEALIEYVAAWTFGLLIFQALFMRSMFSSYLQAIRATLFSETVSMNLVMTGMIPTILVIKTLYPIAADPRLPYFWGMMSLATLIGFLFGYPINSWLVRQNFKHGMMSRPTNGHPMMHHQPARISPGRAWGHIAWTYALLIAAVWIISIWIPVQFT